MKKGPRDFWLCLRREARIIDIGGFGHRWNSVVIEGEGKVSSMKMQINHCGSRPPEPPPEELQG